MKKQLSLGILLGILFLNEFATGAEDNSLRDAQAACQANTAGAETTACLSAVAKADYFEANAVAACRVNTAGADTTKCLSAAADREYRGEAAIHCKRNTAGSATTDCLEAAGRILSKDKTCNTLPYHIKILLRQARQNLEEGKVKESKKILDSILE